MKEENAAEDISTKTLSHQYCPPVTVLVRKGASKSAKSQWLETPAQQLNTGYPSYGKPNSLCLGIQAGNKTAPSGLLLTRHFYPNAFYRQAWLSVALHEHAASIPTLDVLAKSGQGRVACQATILSKTRMMMSALCSH